MTEPDHNTIDLRIDGIDQATAVGLGGNALVYRARQIEFDRIVAVKVLRHSSDERAQLRFDRERRAMGRTTGHPHIAAVYSSGYTPSGEPYLIMPFYDKGSLQDLLDEGPLSIDHSVEIMATVARAVDYAHSLKIVHRDLKPANILLEGVRHPVVTDFGIAQIVGTNVSATALTMTPLFTAPEIFDGVQPSIATDVYSLGASLYALLTGTPAFRGDNDDSIIAIIRRVADEPVPRLGDPVPDWLSDLIVASMSKDPADRPVSAGEFAAALEARGAAPTPTPPPAPHPEPDPEPRDAPPSPVVEPVALTNAPREREMSRGAVAVTTALLVAAAAVIIGLVAMRSSDTSNTAGSDASGLEVTADDPDAATGSSDTEIASDDSTDAPPSDDTADISSEADEAGLDADGATPPQPESPPGPALNLRAAQSTADSATLDIVSYGCGRARFDQAIRVSRRSVIAPPHLGSAWMTRVETGNASESVRARSVAQSSGDFAVLELRDAWPRLNNFTETEATSLEVWFSAAHTNTSGQRTAQRPTTDDPWTVANAPLGAVVWAGEAELLGIVSDRSGTLASVASLATGLDDPTPADACLNYRTGSIAPDQWRQVADPAVSSFLLAQQLADALATQNWPLARTLEPIRADYTDARFEQGWGALRASMLIPVQFTANATADGEAGSSSTHLWRLGLVGHERLGGRDITVAFCATWQIDLAAGTMQQLADDVVALWNQDDPLAGWVPAGELHELLFQC